MPDRLAGDIRICDYSGKRPTTEEYAAVSDKHGGYYDGGFFHCPCGSIQPWCGNPFDGRVFIQSHLEHRDERVS